MWFSLGFRVSLERAISDAGKQTPAVIVAMILRTIVAVEVVYPLCAAVRLDSTCTYTPIYTHAHTRTRMSAHIHI